jgi:hypothetical protein
MLSGAKHLWLVFCAISKPEILRFAQNDIATGVANILNRRLSSSLRTKLLQGKSLRRERLEHWH